MTSADPYEAELYEDYCHCPLRENTTSDDERDENLALYSIFRATQELPSWNVGDVFKSRDFFHNVLQQYAVMSKRPIKLHRNDKTKLRAKCLGQGCQWFVYLRKNCAYNPEDYIVKRAHKEHAHTCTEVQQNKWITARWLGKQFTEKIKANPHIPIQTIRQCVDEQYGSLLSRMKAYRARETALEGIHGKTGRQYSRLFDYKAELLRTHPGSTIEILYERHRDEGAKGPRFMRFYCCLGPLKRGWKAFCRPIIFLDACFLRGMYKGQLITAIGIDPNNGWWPIAWAVAEIESYHQWKWFLEYLQEDLEISADAPRFVFMSDQQNVKACILLQLKP